MSNRHLQNGDPQPAWDTSKKFRIYNMKFCPFAQRPLLVASAKGLVDYDIVNIKLRDDLPEWYTSINPLCKVPAIQFPDGEATVYDSLIISDLLDDLYPEKQLNPKDPKEKARQKLFVDRFGNTFIPSFYKHMREKTEETRQELVRNIYDAEKFLTDRKSKFFGGDEAGMIDFMLWPWFERLPIWYPLSADVHPNLTNWVNLMKDETAVKERALPLDKYRQFYEGYIKGHLDYDMV